jgi:signal transduction histidine kinase
MVVVVLVLFAVGFVVLRSVNDHLLGQVDQGLINGASYTDARLAHHESVTASVPAGQLGQGFFDGRLAGASDNVRGMPPLIRVRPSQSVPLLTTIHDRRFGYIRLLEQPVASSHGKLIIVSGQQINEIIDADHRLTELLVIVLPLLAAVLGILIWLVVGRAMRPVEAIRATVAEISVGNLEERVPGSGSGDELDRLAETMNRMLDRLSAAVTRERRFVADASHELRSPIAALRAALEVSPRDQAQGRSNDAALSALQRLDVLAEDLLVLDAADHPGAGRAPQLVDLDELVLEQVSQLRQVTELDLDVSGVSAGQVFAREVDMMRIIENLSSNACRHAASRIAFGVREFDDRVWLSVSDDGVGVPGALHEQVFERFARLDSERSQGNGGSGLGLAIVAKLVASYDGQVWLEDAHPHGARFVVELPASVAA